MGDGYGRDRKYATAGPGEDLSASMSAESNDGRFFAGLQIVFYLVEVGAEEDERSGDADDEGGAGEGGGGPGVLPGLGLGVVGRADG